MKRFLLVAALTFLCSYGMDAAVVPERVEAPVSVELSSIFEYETISAAEAVQVPANPVEVSESETISDYTASVVLIDLQHFYRTIDYENRFIEKAKKAAAEFKKIHGNELNKLHGLSKGDIDAITPHTTDLKTYEVLIRKLQKSSKIYLRNPDGKATPYSS